MPQKTSQRAQAMAVSHGEIIKPHMGMTIIELEGDHDIEEKYVLEKLAWLRWYLGKYMKFPPRYFRTPDSRKKVVQITDWESMEAHFQDLHSSPLIVDALDEMGEYLDVMSNLHLNVPYLDVKPLLDYPTITLCRLFVRLEQKEEFTAGAAEMLDGLSAIAGLDIAAGWRIPGGWKDQGTLPDSTARYNKIFAERNIKADVDPDDTFEFTFIQPWRSAEDRVRFVNDKERIARFFSHLAHTARTDIMHLEPLELPEMDPTEWEKEYEEYFGDDDEDDYEHDDE